MTKAHGKRVTELATRLLDHPGSKHDAVLQEMAGELSTIGAQLSKAEGHDGDEKDGATNKKAPAEAGHSDAANTTHEVTGRKPGTDATKDETGAYRDAPYQASTTMTADADPIAAKEHAAANTKATDTKAEKAADKK